MTNIVISEDKTEITYETSVLKPIDSESILEYKVTNNSSQYDANVSVTCEAKTEDNSDLYSITQNPSEQVISAKEVGVGTVTVKLLKNVLTETSIEFKCTLNVEAVERTESNNTIVESNTYSISGYLHDENNKTITNQTMAVYSETQHLVTTDENGYFYVNGLEQGEHEIYVLSGTIDDYTEKSKEEIETESITINNLYKYNNDTTFDNGYK